MSGNDKFAHLTPEERAVLLEAGTEAPFSGKLLNEHRKGTYYCKACGAKLFSSEVKFESGCGWPSFYKPSDNDNVTLHPDYSIPGRPRTEVRCKSCGSHLGHVFDDAPQTPTGQRYCINSVAIKFSEEPVDNSKAR